MVAPRKTTPTNTEQPPEPKPPVAPGTPQDLIIANALPAATIPVDRAPPSFNFLALINSPQLVAALEASTQELNTLKGGSTALSEVRAALEAGLPLMTAYIGLAESLGRVRQQLIQINAGLVGLETTLSEMARSVEADGILGKALVPFAKKRARTLGVKKGKVTRARNKRAGGKAGEPKQ